MQKKIVQRHKEYRNSLNHDYGSPQSNEIYGNVSMSQISFNILLDNAFF